MTSPFRILYSNDTVNTVSCTSPWHAQGAPFTQAALEASIDETAGTGVDVHMLQPGVTMAPWWRSRQYPYAEHVAWYERTYGTRVRDNPYAAYMLGGGDMVGAFVARCRLRGLAPFVSLRMNDSHGKEFVNTPGGGAIEEIPGYSLHCVNKFYKDNPQFRIDPVNVDKDHWNVRVLNWANPEVRDWMFGFIREICEGYDIDGLELDFMRHCNYFRSDETTLAQRAGVMTGFIQRVRALLDRTSRRGRHRWLGARLPCYVEPYEPLGFDLPAMVRAGLEIVNLSSYYLTAQQTDLAGICRLVPDAAVHLELTHAVTSVGRVPGAYDTSIFLWTTDEQFYTAAHLAYARGARGVSTFNFAYFREHGAPGRGPFHEPPFHVFKHLRDPAWVAAQPQHYFLSGGASWAAPLGRPNLLPKAVKAGAAAAAFALDLAPPRSGWRKGGRLRVLARDALADSQWTASLNGIRLTADPDRSDPYPHPYARPAGLTERRRAWTVPATLPRAGQNTLEIALIQGRASAAIDFIDLALA